MRKAACCLVALLAIAGCSSADTVTATQPAESSVSTAAPTADVGTETGPDNSEAAATAVEASAGAVWGNGRALTATALGSGRTAVVTTIGVNMVDGSDIETLDRFTTTTRIASTATSSDSTMLVVATTEPSQITWYDLVAGTSAGRQDLPPDFLVRQISFASDGSTLWVQAPDRIATVSVGDAAPDVIASFDERVGALSVSPVNALVRSFVAGTNQVVTVAADGDSEVDPIDELGDESIVGTRLSASGDVLTVMAEAPSDSTKVPRRVVVLDAASHAVQASLDFAPTSDRHVWAMSDSHVAVADGFNVELQSLDGSEIARLEGRDGSLVQSLFLVDDSVIGVYRDGSMLRWTTSDPEPVVLVEPVDGALESAQLAPDRSAVVTVERSGAVTTVSLAESVDVVRNQDFAIGEVTNVDIDEASARIAASTTTGELVVLDPALAVQTRFPVATGRVGSVEFVPGDSAIVTGLNERTGALAFDDTVSSWDPSTGQASFQIGGESEDVVGCSSFFNRVRFLDGGAVMATTSHDFTVGLVDTSSGEELFRFEPEPSTLLDVAVTPDGSKLIVSTDLGTYTVWDVANRVKLASNQASIGGYGGMTVLPDNQTMATTDVTGALGLVDIDTGDRLVEFGDVGRGAALQGVIALSADGSLLAAPTGDNAVGIWSTLSGEQVTTLVGHTAAVTDVDIAADMSFVVTSSSDGTIRTWTLEPG